MNKTIEDTLADVLFRFVKNRGFPYYQFTQEEKRQEFDRIKNYAFEKVMNGNVIKQTMHGLGLAWSYHPHSWSVPVYNALTPMDIYSDDELLRKAIIRRLQRGGLEMIVDGCRMTDSQIRKALKSYSGVQAVSNFRPSAAASIYRRFCGDGVVWDMSCGFGGRLLGALLSGSVKHYIGTDPSEKTMQGLKAMRDDFADLPLQIELHQLGSECFTPTQEVDLCFTSPPYFNAEKYANEATQSYICHDTVDKWNNDFLRKTIKNCHKALKPNGYLLLNVANVKTHKTLEQDTLDIAGQERFELHDVLKMQLSSIVNGAFKYEPIFVFKKSNKQNNQRWLC